MDTEVDQREREAENEVSDDTIETLSVSEVDAEGEVFGDAAETPKLEGTTLPLPIHGQKEAENYVCEDSEDTLEILSGFEVDAESEVLGRHC